jgi:hypothetical protein
MEARVSVMRPLGDGDASARECARVRKQSAERVRMRAHLQSLREVALECRGRVGVRRVDVSRRSRTARQQSSRASARESERRRTIGVRACVAECTAAPAGRQRAVCCAAGECMALLKAAQPLALWRGENRPSVSARKGLNCWRVRTLGRTHASTL